MDLENIIKKLSKEQNISIRQLCIKIGMTESGLSKALQNNTLRVETLQKIANALNVHIGYFFKTEKVEKRIENPYFITSVDMLMSMIGLFLVDIKNLLHKQPELQKQIKELHSYKLISGYFLENKDGIDLASKQREEMVKDIWKQKKEINDNNNT